MTNIEPEAGIVLRDCLHSFCSECLAATIKHSEDIPVTCPYNDEYVCDSMIQEREIQYVITAAV